MKEKCHEFRWFIESFSFSYNNSSSSKLSHRHNLYVYSSRVEIFQFACLLSHFPQREEKSGRLKSKESLNGKCHRFSLYNTHSHSHLNSSTCSAFWHLKLFLNNHHHLSQERGVRVQRDMEWGDYVEALFY